MARAGDPGEGRLTPADRTARGRRHAQGRPPSRQKIFAAFRAAAWEACRPVSASSVARLGRKAISVTSTMPAEQVLIGSGEPLERGPRRPPRSRLVALGIRPGEHRHFGVSGGRAELRQRAVPQVPRSISAASALISPTCSAHGSCAPSPRRSTGWSITRVGQVVPAAVTDAPPATTTERRSRSYPGLITCSMISSRSSNGRNADFIAFTVNHCRVSQP